MIRSQKTWRHSASNVINVTKIEIEPRYVLWRMLSPLRCVWYTFRVLSRKLEDYVGFLTPLHRKNQTLSSLLSVVWVSKQTGNYEWEAGRHWNIRLITIAHHKAEPRTVYIYLDLRSTHRPMRFVNRGIYPGRSQAWGCSGIPEEKSIEQLPFNLQHISNTKAPRLRSTVLRIKRSAVSLKRTNQPPMVNLRS